MKKQLGMLAASVLVASSAQAATLVLQGSGGTYVQDITGDITGDLLLGTASASVDITAGLAAVGTLQNFAFYETSGTNTGAGYADANFGYVTAGGTPASTADHINVVSGLNTYAGTFSGAIGNNAPGDADITPVLVNNGLLVDATVAQALIFIGEFDGSLTPDTKPLGALTGGVVGSNFVIGGSAPVPVPAAAWLFGSALMGLGVVRRKK